MLMKAPFLLTKIIEAALDLKAQNLIQIDMEGRSSLSDYILICHGTSTAHAKGISDKINVSLKHEGVLPLGIEGYSEGEWILLDYNEVIVNVFIEESRQLYDLEELYQDHQLQTFE